MDTAFELVRHAEELMVADFDNTRRDYETKKQLAKAKRELWEKEVAATAKTGLGKLAARQMPSFQMSRLGHAFALPM